MKIVPSYYRLILPGLVLIIMVGMIAGTTDANITHTRSIQAFFDITSQSEYVTFLLFILWAYIVFMPGIWLWLFRTSVLNVNSTSDTLILTSSDPSGTTARTIRFDPMYYTSYETLMTEVNHRLKPFKIFVTYDSTQSVFQFRSPYDFSFAGGSTFLTLLGFDGARSYKAVPDIPKGYGAFDTTTCTFFLLESPSAVYVSRLGFFDNFITTFRSPRRLAVYVFFSLSFIIWKIWTTKTYRTIGASIRSDTISSDHIHNLNENRKASNQWALLLIFFMAGYSLFSTLTNQDLTPRKDLRFRS